MPPISIIHPQSELFSSALTTAGIGLPKSKEMEFTRRRFSKEKLLLALIIGIGCYGFSLNFQNSRNDFPISTEVIDFYGNTGMAQRQAQLGPLEMEGTFLAGDPIRFTLKGKQFRKSGIEVDFGNGTQQSLSKPVFIYAYRHQGQFELKIKQNGAVLFQTRLYITDSNQLVMN